MTILPLPSMSEISRNRAQTSVRVRRLCNVQHGPSGAQFNCSIFCKYCGTPCNNSKTQLESQWKSQLKCQLVNWIEPQIIKVVLCHVFYKCPRLVGCSAAAILPRQRGISRKWWNKTFLTTPYYRSANMSSVASTVMEWSVTFINQFLLHNVSIMSYIGIIYFPFPSL